MKHKCSHTKMWRSLYKELTLLQFAIINKEH